MQHKLQYNIGVAMQDNLTQYYQWTQFQVVVNLPKLNIHTFWWRWWLKSSSFWLRNWWLQVVVSDEDACEQNHLLHPFAYPQPFITGVEGNKSVQAWNIKHYFYLPSFMCVVNSSPERMFLHIHHKLY